MFAYFEGSVKAIQQDYIILLVQGVGYKIHVPANIKASIRANEFAALFVETIVREDSITIYGFTDESDKELFLTLISVQGVGAKMGLAMLGALVGDDIRLAIMAGDITTLCRVPGVGKKLAARIVQELQDKITPAANASFEASSGAKKDTPARDTINQDLVAALVGLGYQQSQSYKVALQLQNEHADLSLEALLPLALQQLN